uniref:Uncharacterized protein n=1 Tax=Rhizophora mucronata TaxID=61149 RepID=A0A2P2QJ56_RHIMU
MNKHRSTTLSILKHPDIQRQIELRDSVKNLCALCFSICNISPFGIHVAYLDS